MSSLTSCETEDRNKEKNWVEPRSLRCCWNQGDDGHIEHSLSRLSTVWVYCTVKEEKCFRIPQSGVTLPFESGTSQVFFPLMPSREVVAPGLLIRDLNLLQRCFVRMSIVKSAEHANCLDINCISSCLLHFYLVLCKLLQVVQFG